MVLALPFPISGINITCSYTSIVAKKYINLAFIWCDAHWHMKISKLGQHCNLLAILHLARRQRKGLRCITNLSEYDILTRTSQLLCHHAERLYQFHSNVALLRQIYDITSKILQVSDLVSCR